jgi:hypothetical protein
MPEVEVEMGRVIKAPEGNKLTIGHPRVWV